MLQKLSNFINDHLIAIVIIITFVVLLSVVLIPTIYVFFLSFFSVHISGKMTFLGFGNYIRALSDPAFWQFLYQTLIYTFGSLTISFLIGFISALALNKIAVGKGLFRSLTLLPWVIPPAISGLIWRWMLNDSVGLFNDILNNKLHIIRENILFLGTYFWAKFTVILADSWTRIPFITILLLAGLQSISQEYYDAARVDGASAFQQLFRITVPLMRSTILVVLMIITMFVMRTYEIIYILTDGGPGNSTEVLTTYIYKNTVNYWELGYGSALSVVLLFIVIIITLYYTRQLVRRSMES